MTEPLQTPSSPSASESLLVRVPCPLCKSPIAISGDGPENATCGSCGLSCLLQPPPRIQEDSSEPPRENEKVAESGDLVRWLAGEPVRPRQLSTGKRARRWCRKHPLKTALAASLCGILILSAAVSNIAYLDAVLVLSQQKEIERKRQDDDQQARQQIKDQLKLTQRRLRQAELSAKETQRKLRQELAIGLREATDRCLLAERARDAARLETSLDLSHKLSLRARSLAEEDPRRSLLLAAEALDLAIQSDETPSHLAHQLLRNGLHSSEGRVLSGHSQRVTSLEISSDGRWLASGSFDGTARLWDLADEDPGANAIVLDGQRQCVTSVAFSPDHRWLSTGSSDGGACLWDMTSASPKNSRIQLQGHRGRLRFLSISSDSHWLVSGSSGLTARENTTRLWALSADNPSRASVSLQGASGTILAMAMSPDSRWVATANQQGDIFLFDLHRPHPSTLPVVLRGHGGAVNQIAFSPDSRWLASGGGAFPTNDFSLRLWDFTATGSPSSVVLKGHTAPIRNVVFSPDGRWLASAGDDQTVRLWNMGSDSTPSVAVSLIQQKAPIHDTKISPDSHWLITSSVDGTVSLWDLRGDSATGKLVIIPTKQGRISALAVSPDSRTLATAGEDSTIRLWSLSLKDLVEIAQRSLSEPQLSETPRLAERPTRLPASDE